jgi:hypothetical protein
MSNYIKNNSKRCGQPFKYTNIKVQSYDPATFGQVVNMCTPISCNVSKLCDSNNRQFGNYVLAQQNLYQRMRLHPEQFPILSSVQNSNLKLWEQRKYSNLWYRQFGTSQAMPVNDNYGGFYLVGSEVPYTN